MLVLFIFSVLILIGSLLKERKLEQQYVEALEGDNLSNEKIDIELKELRKELCSPL